MIMKNKYILLTLLLPILIGCKRVTLGFEYAPSAPRAGELVSFFNTSSGGEDYFWTFGDNVTSESKSPGHRYKKPGTYIITMREAKTQKTLTRTITVSDTIPSFAADTNIIRYCEPITFRAQLYNPFSHTITYQWELDEYAVPVGESMTADTLRVYFTAYNRLVTVRLTITDNGVPYPTITKTFNVHDVAAQALLCRCEGPADYRQRIYENFFELPLQLSDSAVTSLLDRAQDTVASYGDKVFRLATLDIPDHPSVQGFQLDPVSQKIYFRDGEGLFIANVNGSNVTRIEDEAVSALCVDAENGRVYWSVADGVKFIPLIRSRDNRFTYKPEYANTLTDVVKLAFDYTPRTHQSVQTP